MNTRICSLSRLLLVACTLALSSCAPQDYEKPIQQFQDASAIVISGARALLVSVNVTEENATIEGLAFEHKAIDPAALEASDLMTREEIDLRIRTLDLLTQYTSALAALASGKQSASIAESTQSLSQALTQLSKDAGALQASRSTILHNANFAGAAGAAAGAIGEVAQLIAEHKARREIEVAVRNSDPTITKLMDLLSGEVQAAYARQRSTLGASGVYLFNIYKDELSATHTVGNADTYVLMNIAREIEKHRARESAVRAADPAKSLARMKAAHIALVAYVNSNKDPKALSELLKAGEDFVNTAKPFGDAAEAFWKLV